MEPAVSILIPAFNCEKYIRWTIESALAQTWPKKEIIVVDDGSSDNTFWIARQFESNSVKVIKQDNMGASAARNKALGLAQGDYIQWLDADDILHPDKIRLQIKKMIQENDHSVLLSSSWGKFYYRTEKAKFLPNRLWQDLDPVDWLVIKFLENLYMISSSWLVSRVLTNLAGPWNEKLSLDDDGEYICRIVASSKRIVFVEDSKTYYRISNTRSLSRSTSEPARLSLFLSISLCIDHLLSLEDSTRTRAACLKLLQLWLYHFHPDGAIESDEDDPLTQDILSN